MSGYLEAQLIILCLSTIYAYGIFIPAASGQLSLVQPVLSRSALMRVLGLIQWMVLGSRLRRASFWPWFYWYCKLLISFPILRTKGVYMVLACIC